MTDYTAKIRAFIRRESKKLETDFLCLGSREGYQELHKFNARLNTQYNNARFVESQEEIEAIYAELKQLKQDFVKAMEEGEELYVLKLEHQRSLATFSLEDRERINWVRVRQGLQAI